MKIFHIQSKIVASFIFLVVLFIGTVNCQSQDITKDAIKWQFTVDFDQAQDSTALSYTSYFIIYGQDKVEWITNRTDKTGQISSTSNVLRISTVTGSWKNIKEDGEIMYKVTMNKSEGTFNVKKTKGVYSISVSLVGKTGGKLNRVFKINNVAKQ